MNEDKFKCVMCNAQFINNRQLSAHIQMKHRIKTKDYYDKYIKTITEGKCLECGKETNFKNIGVGYRQFCSNVCCTKYAWKHRTSDDIENIKKKSENTKLNRYNDKNFNNREKYKQTCLEKYGVDSTNKVDSIKNKKINTWISKYGVDNPRKSNVIKQKIKETFYTNYGCYSTKSPKVQEKLKSTNLQRYGVEFPLQNTDIYKKAANTMHKNGNSSSYEDYMEEQLISILGDGRFIHEYSDNRYPYSCDFYIPEFDLFIEINGFWTHGGHWFDENNNDDINTLKQLQKKSDGSNIYSAAIEIWTKRDLMKRDTAIANNLNYVVLWDMDEIKLFLEEFKKWLTIK